MECQLSRSEGVQNGRLDLTPRISGQPLPVWTEGRASPLPSGEVCFDTLLSTAGPAAGDEAATCHQVPRVRPASLPDSSGKSRADLPVTCRSPELQSRASRGRRSRGPEPPCPPDVSRPRGTRAFPRGAETPRFSVERGRVLLRLHGPRDGVPLLGGVGLAAAPPWPGGRPCPPRAWCPCFPGRLAPSCPVTGPILSLVLRCDGEIPPRQSAGPGRVPFSTCGSRSHAFLAVRNSSQTRRGRPVPKWQALHPFPLVVTVRTAEVNIFVRVPRRP